MGARIEILKIADGQEVIWCNWQDLFLYTTEDVYHGDWKSGNHVPIPKGTRIKVYDIMQNFYGKWVETYYEGRYYSIDPCCLEYRRITKKRQRMTDEELKKKIIEVLEETEYEWTEEKNGYILQIFYDKLADALIAAGIGDVKEEKFEADHYWNMWQGAEVAEHNKNVYFRALYNLSLKYVVANNISTIIGDDGNEYIAGQEVCALSVMANEVKKAEKELAEEGEDD